MDDMRPTSAVIKPKWEGDDVVILFGTSGKRYPISNTRWEVLKEMLAICQISTFGWYIVDGMSIDGIAIDSLDETYDTFIVKFGELFELKEREFVTFLQTVGHAHSVFQAMSDKLGGESYSHSPYLLITF